MWKFLHNLLAEFRTCFSREAAYEWFVVIIIGFMMGVDKMGATSFIRILELHPNHYKNVLHFFRADSWDVDSVRKKWGTIVKENIPTVKVAGRRVLVGDGIKQPKEARKMPGNKRHKQESENVSKSEYIFGHLFGVNGVLVEKFGKMFCLPIGVSVQNGVDKIREWNQEKTASMSHVEQIVHMAGQSTEEMGKSITVLDRLHLSVPALKACKAYINDKQEWMLHMVTAAKKSAVAYTDPPPYSGKGRPRKKGKTIKLWDLFKSAIEDFEEVEVNVYNETRTVKCMTRKLLWGTTLYQKLLFVWVDMDGKKRILVSTHLGLSAKQVIELYGWRFKIEIQFKQLRHTIGGFAYRFWSKDMPRLDRFKPTKPDVLETINGTVEKKRITLALKAIEGYVMFACIALGVVQIMALKYGKRISLSSFLFMRTRTSDIPSEWTMTRYFAKNIFRVMEKHSHLGIYRIIRGKQESTDWTEDEGFLDAS